MAITAAPPKAVSRAARPVRTRTRRLSAAILASVAAPATAWARRSFAISPWVAWMAWVI
ncbi:hypothetical protein [Phenylobacterium sp.]|uniref:hypothetical protein n=1 Tax=Phenylobacterium sp. TaxID=1871053 RepID=UPI003BAB147A